MSLGSMTSSTAVIDVTARLPSFTPPFWATWEGGSMIPGITNCPDASITVAPSGTVSAGPTATILPSLMRIDPFAMVPWDTVRIVASLITMGPGEAWYGGAAHATQPRSRRAGTTRFIL